MVDTWAGRSQFTYAGSVRTGTEITYGDGNHVSVSAAQYQALINNFAGQVVDVTPSRTDAGAGSLEEWFQNNVTQTAIASYVAPILIREGVATRTDNNQLQF